MIVTPSSCDLEVGFLMLELGWKSGVEVVVVVAPFDHEGGRLRFLCFFGLMVVVDCLIVVCEEGLRLFVRAQ